MNKNDIKIGITGKILEGRHQDWYIFVKDDSQNTGGYLILVFDHREQSKSTKGYDRWAEDDNILLEMFKSANWKVHWIDENVNPY